MTNVPILQKTDSYTFRYQKPLELTEQQIEARWTAEEVLVEKDLYDLYNSLSPAEKHGVITTLTLFTRYELTVGSDFWLGRMMRIFKRPELQRMFAEFGNTELNTHAPFYSKINELLGLNTDDFYMSYTEDPVLMARMGSINEAVGLKITDEADILKSVGAFSIVEGAILYSSFAFLKHFQNEGKNKLANIVAGIDFSVRDEHLHSIGGAWLFRQMMEEGAQHGEVKKFLTSFCKTVREHEHKINAMIFSEGNIEGITENQMNHFSDSRLNLCMNNLGYGDLFEVTYNPIAKWFYKSLQSDKLHDFFNTQGNAYTRDWKEEEFVWA